MIGALLLAAAVAQADARAGAALAEVELLLADAKFEQGLRVLKGMDLGRASRREQVKAHFLRAECLTALRRHGEAADAFADALMVDPAAALDGATAGPALVAALERARERLVGTLEVETPVPGVAFLVDGEPAGKTPAEVRVLAGRHSVVAQGSKAVEVVEVAAGARAAVALGMPPVVEEAPAPASPPSPRANLAPLFPLIAGGAAVAGGAVLWGLSRAQADRLRLGAKEPQTFSSAEELEAAARTGRTLEGVGAALVVAGSVAVAVGAIWAIAAAGAEVETSVAPTDGGAAFMLRGRF